MGLVIQRARRIFAPGQKTEEDFCIGGGCSLTHSCARCGLLGKKMLIFFISRLTSSICEAAPGNIKQLIVGK